MMDFGTEVTCHRCTHKAYFFYDTHGTGEWGSVAGLCPHCNAMISAKIVESVVYPHEHPKGVSITPVPYYEPEVATDENL